MCDILEHEWDVDLKPKGNGLQKSKQSSFSSWLFWNKIIKIDENEKIQFSIGFPLSRLEHDLKNFSHRPISNFEILRSQKAYSSILWG